jgi:hypothetical protein
VLAHAQMLAVLRLLAASVVATTVHHGVIGLTLPLMIVRRITGRGFAWTLSDRTDMVSHTARTTLRESSSTRAHPLRDVTAARVMMWY